MLGAALLFGIGVYLPLLPVNPQSHTFKYVTVRPGETATAIGESLRRQGIIRSAWAFAFLSQVDHLASSLKSGVYRLSPHDSLTAILDRMRAGQVVVIKVTIPEGFTVKQVVARLVAAHIGTPADYRSLLAKPLPGMPAPATGVRDPWEGYLFPATYSFAWGTTPQTALAVMWQTFQARVRPLYRAAHTSLTFTQWVTLASIIQSEDGVASDAPKIAAVFMNRMAAGMPLQSDATVRYALQRTVAGGLTLGDLRVASAYNTYLHRGLPPGPICNPGLLMLRAALSPAPVPYLYFLALRNGKDLFATTYQQHLSNIAWANAHS
ncbi:MAG: endolytic transglycosylase MltG [Thermaerobacter sp.]|nr:endolytic transglycosylase MltG [Thermaerobacter sp.]